MFVQHLRIFKDEDDGRRVLQPDRKKEKKLQQWLSFKSEAKGLSRGCAVRARQNFQTQAMSEVYDDGS